MTAIFRVQRHIRNPTSSMDACLLLEKFGQILSLSAALCNSTRCFDLNSVTTFIVTGSVIFKVLHFPALRFGPSYSSPAFSVFVLFYSAVFRFRKFSAPMLNSCIFYTKYTGLQRKHIDDDMNVVCV